ncbi:MAG TPA: hypothetical protein VF039_11055 [Longimicrobiales bacterium]
MSERLRAALNDRLTDPVAWFAATMISLWAVAAVWGISPIPLLGALGFVGALGEWITLARWYRTRRGQPAGTWLPLRQAADRWKVLVLIVISLLTLAVELWIDSKQEPGFWNVGLTLFGVSTLLFLWYAWSRPVAVDADGLILGASRVPWADVAGVDLDVGERNHLAFRLSRAHHLFGTRVSGSLEGSDLAELARLVPLRLRSTVDESLR